MLLRRVKCLEREITTVLTLREELPIVAASDPALTGDVKNTFTQPILSARWVGHTPEKQK